MTYNFDELIDRRTSGSIKWNDYAEDVLPLWVADMDFRSPDPIAAALQQKVAEGVFGYEWPRRDLAELICARLERLYHWKVLPEEVIFLPGIVCGLNLVCHAFGKPGDAALTLTPIYPPFLAAPTNQEMELQTVELKAASNGSILRYEIDFDRIASTITAQTKLLMLCHPHNPTGRDFTSQELTRISEICIEHDILICSDEIHCDLLMSEIKHTPTASLSTEVAARCITLMAPSKTYNMSGLGASYAVVQNPDLRKRMKKAAAGLIPEINIFGISAFKAAYGKGDLWLSEVLAYLRNNRDLLFAFITKELPELKTTVPEATYLAWLDCRQAGIEGSPYRFFLNNSKVALNDGATFGVGGAGFVRFNFGCPTSLMLDALERMKSALRSG
jgi:cystathionine beta-lyase